jgi:hypothetical protein
MLESERRSAKDSVCALHDIIQYWPRQAFDEAGIARLQIGYPGLIAPDYTCRFRGSSVKRNSETMLAGKTAAVGNRYNEGQPS